MIPNTAQVKDLKTAPESTVSAKQSPHVWFNEASESFILTLFIFPNKNVLDAWKSTSIPVNQTSGN